MEGGGHSDNRREPSDSFGCLRLPAVRSWRRPSPTNHRSRNRRPRFLEGRAQVRWHKPRSRLLRAKPQSSEFRLQSPRRIHDQTLSFTAHLESGRGPWLYHVELSNQSTERPVRDYRRLEETRPERRVHRPQRSRVPLICARDTLPDKNRAFARQNPKKG